MLKNPFINALMAAGYISGIVFVMRTLSSVKVIEESPLIPMAMLSLFVLSAALMGVLFFYQAISLFLENKKPEAVIFLFKSLGTFVIFILILAVLIIYVQ